jgi:hypothetical protein
MVSPDATARRRHRSDDATQTQYHAGGVDGGPPTSAAKAILPRLLWRLATVGGIGDRARLFCKEGQVSANPWDGTLDD